MSWNLITDDFFGNSPSTGATGSRANSAVSTTAGSNTAVGNGWIDPLGSVAHIVAGNLKLEPAASQSLYKCFCVRPAAEETADQRIVGYIPANISGAYTNTVVLRFSVNGSNQVSYYLCNYIGSSTTIFRIVNNTNTNIGSINTANIVTANGARLDWSITGNVITCTGTDLVTGNVLSTGSVTDAGSALPAGVPGFGVFPDNPAYWSRAQVYTSVVTGIAPNPTSVTVNTAGSSIALAGTGTTWTPGTPGSPTFSLTGGTGASITAQTITSSTAATITVTAGSAVGSLTIGDGTNNANLDVTSVPALLPGIVSLTSRNTSLVAVLSSTASTAGTSPYIRQWQLSTTSSTTGFANISGATAATYTYTAGSVGQYWFRCAYTDSAAQTANSNVLSVVLATEQINVWAIGDSVTWGASAGGTQLPIPPIVAAAANLETFNNGYRMVVVDNRGVSSTTSNHWTFEASTGYLSALITAANAISNTKKYAVIQLGVNDKVAPTPNSTYKANLQNICRNLLANGIVPVLSICFNVPNSPQILTYQGIARSLASGFIKPGDYIAQTYFENRVPELYDGTTHPSPAGAANYGRDLVCPALYNAIYGLTTATKRTIKL